MKLNPLSHPQAGACLGILLALAGTAAAQTSISIPATFAHPVNQADTTAPGFRVRTVQSTNTLDTSLLRAEAQLAGLLINDATGQPFDNIADTSTFGADGYYAESTVIDYDQNGASASGLSIPGITGATGTDNFSVEALTYLNLKPGTYTMVVRSDDGFRVTTAPNPQNLLESVTLGSYDGGRGAGDSAFDFTISAEGLYGFRLVYYEGGSDASVSWYLVDSADPAARILINDANDTSAVHAFQKLTGAGAGGIYADVATPQPNATGVPPKPTLTFRLVDSGGAVVNPASVQLSLDGTALPATATKSGTKTTITHTVADLLNNLSVHTLKLVYADSAATPNVTTVQYNFTVTDYPNLTIPVPPVYSENFNSWEEQMEPPAEFPANTWTYHGWTVEHHSNGGGVEWNLDNPNSDAYQGWVVISKDRINAVGVLDRWDAELRLSLPQQFINRVQVPDIVEGNFFYAESDQRGDSQVQYLFTPDINLTGHSNLYLFYNSMYEQNQDNIGSVEYSIDQGATWLPILYMVDKNDLVLNNTGGIDAEATLTNPQTDTATYFDETTGETIGGYYGAFIGAAPATWPTLAPYISGRINDDPLESKRVEFHRIPQADNQAKVRFRFAQAGTASWYFGIDNFAIYAMPADTAPPLNIAWQNGKVVISWPATAADWKLQSSTALAAGSWTDAPGAAVSGSNMILEVTPSAPRLYYRLYK
ncbi:MAG: Immunoglobulin I-set domain protein [Verrucomicrobiales bacterium]|nr:Immunoglobulin I-set domain protein [Verrucomicrobiales bacterium]